MRFKVDHDMHIHTGLSTCSNDPEQTTERILQYAIDNNFKRVAVTDHFWDEAIEKKISFYDVQNYGRVSQVLPLPKAEGIEFLFGCEADMDKDLVIGITKEACEKFDFVIISTTHMHSYYEPETPLEDRARIYVERFRKVLDSDLPFRKMGIAHLTSYLMAAENWQDHLTVLDMISDSEFESLFSDAAKKGCGIELNIPIFKYEAKDLDRALRPYRIAKECGCKFYLGSDAHHPDRFNESVKAFEYIVDLLELTEEDKFTF